MDNMTVMYVVFAAIVLVFVLVVVSCRLSIKPYKDMIKMQADRIEDLEKRLSKTDSKPKSKTEQKKDDD